MAAAHILFMSDEWLPCPPQEWARRVQNRYGNEIVVIGLGSKGALLSVKQDNFLEQLPAVRNRKVVNTIGAGDGLHQRVIAHRLVEVERGAGRRVEARHPHGAHKHQP